MGTFAEILYGIVKFLNSCFILASLFSLIYCFVVEEVKISDNTRVFHHFLATYCLFWSVGFFILYFIQYFTNYFESATIFSTSFVFFNYLMFAVGLLLNLKSRKKI
jgi:hypothetical protein